ncbi:IS256 family transposase [Methylosinus sp. C49]|uniref:IS256 family transposase n=1 Tax=Methylosinus sp. C49 TaxID=2699395 RepID=UPI00137A3400|nr:IS256 family transposase [Methylosinus sp. C49]
MNENRVVALRQEGEIDDPLTEILRAGAKRLIAQAVEAEFEAFLDAHADLALPDGRRRVVRHGREPARMIQTGIGPVEVEKPKARDRGAPNAETRIRYASSILPQWARRTKSLDALLPALYLAGVSTGDFQDVLTALLGKDAPNLSPAVISRLKGEWEEDYSRWQTRDLATRRYVYLWADGVYLQARMEPQAECMLVLIGATPEGKKELVGFQTGMRESAQNWKELLVDLKNRGLVVAPEIAIGDGALGFWKALDEAFPKTRHQRCWVHKTLNILDKLPKSVQPNAHRDLREIWQAPSRAAAEAAMTTFAEKYAPKYQKAVDCLLKDRDTLLTFFDFPAEHFVHLRTSNPIESVFSTVRHRTVRVKGALSQDTARLMVFKLVMAASKNWRRLKGQNQLPKLIQGVTFRDGIEIACEAKTAA